jgi:hypothetical protein
MLMSFKVLNCTFFILSWDSVAFLDFEWDGVYW